MATIDAGGSGHGREYNRELALVPFIDFLLCLVAFLLVTAVWSTQARLPAEARVPGVPDCCTPPARPKMLHLDVRDRKFEISWRQGATVLSTRDVAKTSVQSERGDVRYPALAEALAGEWRTHGVHRAPGDHERDTAVVHTPNSLSYAELIGVLDAIRSTERSDARAGEAAFAVSFAVD